MIGGRQHHLVELFLYSTLHVHQIEALETTSEEFLQTLKTGLITFIYDCSDTVTITVELFCSDVRL